MKYRWDKKYLHWGTTAFLTIAASITFYQLLTNFPAVGEFIGKVLGILSPIIYGFVIAYLLMPCVNFTERKIMMPLAGKLFRGKSSLKSQKRFTRGISVAIILIIAIGLLSLLIWGIVPQIIESIRNLFENMSSYVDNTTRWFKETFAWLDPEAGETASNLLSQISEFIVNAFNGYVLPQLSGYAASVSSGVFSMVGTLLNFLIGIVISVYVMYGRDRFSAQCKKVLYAVLPIDTVNVIIRETKDIDKTFSSFIRGQLLDSLLVGLITFIFMLCTGMPYAALISVLVGLTNIIPFFGPFIGAIPSAFLILLVNPMQCLIFCIFILVLQQIDGNIIIPKVLSYNLGIREFWIIFAILIGGGLFGVVGMAIGVPVFTVLYVALRRLFAKRLHRRNLPLTTDEFMNIRYVDTSGKIVRKSAPDEDDFGPDSIPCGDAEDTPVEDDADIAEAEADTDADNFGGDAGKASSDESGRTDTAQR